MFPIVRGYHRSEDCNSHELKEKTFTWPGWLSLLERLPVRWKAAGSIPHWGTYLGYGSGHIQEATDQCFFLTSLSLPLSPPPLYLPPSLPLLPLSLKAIKKKNVLTWGLKKRDGLPGRFFLPQKHRTRVSDYKSVLSSEPTWMSESNKLR